MGERERETTHKEGLVRESSKGLVSDSHESSQQKTTGEDTRGDLLMAKPALKERDAKKKSKTKDIPEAPEASPSQIQEQARPRPIFLEALFVREFQRMSGENKRLREENEELSEKEEYRKEQQRKRAAKWRESHPETHKERERERYRNRRSEKQ